MSKRKRHKVDRTERVSPTQETAVKLFPDHIKHLEPQLQAAASEIHEAHVVYVRGFKNSLQNHDRPEWIEHDDIRLAPGQIERYRLWRREVARIGYSGALIMDMIDGVPPWECDRLVKCPMGTSADILFESLTIYTRITLDKPRPIVDKFRTVELR